MRPLKTKSFLEGENGMSVDVAGQQLTGTKAGHPFLHWITRLHHGFEPKVVSGKNRSKPAIFSHFQLKSAGVSQGRPK